jgi:FAD:protein FMN transferase
MRTADRKTRHLLSATFLIVSLVSITLLSLSDRSPARNKANTLSHDGLIVHDGQTMGTTYRVLLHESALDEDTKQSLPIKISQLLSILDGGIFSTYAPDSQLSQLNRTAPGLAYQGSTELAQVLNAAMQVYTLSGGAFDISIKPLVDLWGFGAAMPPAGIPAQTEIDQALERTGMEKLLLDKNTRAIVRTEDVTLDLSAIAKGFAVDQLASLLEAEAQQNYLVEIGGEVVTRGVRANGDHWQLGIENPDSGAPGVFREISITEERTAIAASGNYRNFFMHEGRRYSHTLNPVTGWPVSHNLISVTVIAESAMIADAWATALLVLGLEEGVELANELQLPAYFIAARNTGFHIEHSKAFIRYL